MNKKFWNRLRNETSGERVLRLDGMIADSDWWDVDCTLPKNFRDELDVGNGDITVRINSEGGDVFAASAASVIAMAGDEVQISVAGMIMIHNPWTVAQGDSAEMTSTAKMLDGVKESIINAYELKALLSREEISRLMDKASWLNANRAVEPGFADEILFADNQPTAAKEFSQTTVTNSILDKLRKKAPPDNRVNAVEFYQRLNSRRI